MPKTQFVRRRHSRAAIVSDALEGMARGEHVLLVRTRRVGMPGVIARWMEASRPRLVVLGRPLLTPYIEAAHQAGAAVAVDADESLASIAWSVARSRYTPMRSRVRSLIEASLVVERMERRNYARCDAVWVSSEAERDRIARFVDPARIAVVPNAVAVPPQRPKLRRSAPLPSWAGTDIRRTRQPPSS